MDYLTLHLTQLLPQCEHFVLQCVHARFKKNKEKKKVNKRPLKTNVYVNKQTLKTRMKIR